MKSPPIVDLLSWGLSPETSGRWPSASGPLCYAPHCGRLYGPLFYWAISYLVFKVDLAPACALGRVVTAGRVPLPRLARGRACRACKRPAVERSLVGFCFFRTLFKVEQKMVPLAPAHRNSVGIGFLYLETGCGELQLGKNRICDGVVISAPPPSISILGWVIYTLQP